MDGKKSPPSSLPSLERKSDFETWLFTWQSLILHLEPPTLREAATTSPSPTPFSQPSEKVGP